MSEMQREIATGLSGDTGTDPDQDLMVQIRSRWAMAAHLAAARLHAATGADIGGLFEESISMLEHLLAEGHTAQ